MVEWIDKTNEIESLQVEKFCKTMEELINSEDFERAFEIVMKHNKKYDKDYFLWILWKIRKKEDLTEIEKEDIVNLLEDEKVNKIAEKVYSKLKWFTFEETKQFLEKYPVGSIIYYLQKNVKKEFIDILGKKYEVKEKIEVNGEIFFWIVETDDDGNKKYWVIKKWEEDKMKEKLVFDNVNYIKELNWEVYIYWEKDWKTWVIKYWEEKKIGEKLVFKHVNYTQEFDWKVYIYWEKDWKTWRIRYWEEKKIDKCLVRDNWMSNLEKDEKWVYFGYRKNILWFPVSRKKYIDYKNT